MPNISLITGEISLTTWDKLEKLGTVRQFNKREFAKSVATVQKERATDLLVSAFPPIDIVGISGYRKTLSILNDLIYDLRIPVIVYTACDYSMLRLLDTLPAFICHRATDLSELFLLRYVEEIAKFWFPLTTEQQTSFMNDLLRDAATEITGSLTRDHFMMSKFGMFEKMAGKNA